VVVFCMAGSRDASSTADVTSLCKVADNEFDVQGGEGR